jgi:hypothetical protein
MVFRDMPEEHKAHCLSLLQGKKGKHNPLINEPHDDGTGNKPRFPEESAIQQCRAMNYYPEVYRLKPGEFTWLGKNMGHVFAKEAGFNLSIAWDTMALGQTIDPSREIY